MGYKYFSGHEYFVTLKTYGGQLFFDTEEKKQIVKDRIFEYSKKLQIKIVVYAILSNHYHLILRSNFWKNATKFLQMVNGGSSYLLNKTENSEGRGVWDIRWTRPINTEAGMYYVSGYILGNPIKHGLVRGLEELYDYRFCNYQEAVQECGLEYVDDMIHQTIAMNLDLETEEQYLIRERGLAK